MNLVTLIPAFKVQYLDDLLAGLERQTVRADRVLLSDDSPGGDFVRVLQEPAMRARCDALRLQAVPGPRQGASVNVRHLAQQWAGSSELVHLMLDDDLLFPTFYERHLALHGARDFACTVSLRWVADERGLPLERARIPPALLAHPQRMLTIDAAQAFATTVGAGVNWMGEFSNAVLRADMLDFVVAPWLAGVPLVGLEDLSTFLAAATRGPLGIVNEHLGCFRTSPQQNTANVHGSVMKLSTCAWPALALAGQRLNVLGADAVANCLRIFAPMIVGRYHADAELAPVVRAVAAWAAGDHDEAPQQLLRAWTAYCLAKVPHAALGAAPLHTTKPEHTETPA